MEGLKQCGDLSTVATAARLFKSKHKPLTQKTLAAAFRYNIGSVTIVTAQAWLDGQKLSSQSYANNRRVAHLPFEFAVSRSYAHDKPLADTDK